jgi:uncharacterized hydrophobic protein (TIGR00341 family)
MRLIQSGDGAIMAPMERIPDESEVDRTDRVGPVDGKHQATSEELLDALPDTTVVDLPLILLTSIATVVALVGLFLNNVAIVVGAMIVSPLLTPVTGFILELAVGRPHRAFAHLRAFLLLILLVVALSAAITTVLFSLGPVVFTPQIVSRFDRRDVYLVMAVLLGFAAIIAQVKGFRETLVGIGVSIALLPPAAVAGIALALFRTNALSALALAFDNIIGVMIGGFIGVFYFRLGPARRDRKELARRSMRWAFGLLLVLLALLALNLYLTA